jgi:hypothetical protein
MRGREEEEELGTNNNRTRERKRGGGGGEYKINCSACVELTLTPRRDLY